MVASDNAIVYNFQFLVGDAVEALWPPDGSWSLATICHVKRGNVLMHSVNNSLHSYIQIQTMMVIKGNENNKVGLRKTQ